MPRPKAILQSDFPYNISARCINREWFNLPMDRVWEIFCEEINRTTLNYKWDVHSFVLMSNHFHLIASTPHANISKCMEQFMVRTSRRLTREGNRINETFAGRHYKCILQHPNYYLSAYKYNYRNPVSAGLCHSVEQYPYSSLRGLLYSAEKRITNILDSTFDSDRVGTIQWLNTAPPAEKMDCVRQSLKHQYFKSKKSKDRNRPIMDILDTL